MRPLLTIPLILLYLFQFVFTSGQTITQTGQETIDINLTDNQKTRIISFPIPFSEIPSVGVALIGLEQTNAGFLNITTTISMVRATDFTLAISSSDSILTAVQISYIATISHRSGIYISTISINTSQSDVSSSTAVYTDRKYSRAIAVPPGLANVTKIPFLQGLVAMNTRVFLEIDQDGSLSCRTWSDTVFYRADVTIIMYDPSNFAISEAQFGPNQYLHTNLGAAPKLTATYNISFANYTQTPALFLGFRYLDMANMYHYSLAQDIVKKDRVFTVNYVADQMTKIYGAIDFAILACSNSAKGCLCGQGYYPSSPGSCSGTTLSNIFL